jgi:protein-S-isoprenylcysteine O-methyltransferase Ste14
MSVRASPISKVAAILIVFLGLLTLAAGLATGSLASIVAGSAITVVGLALYWLLYWFTRKLGREIVDAESASPPEAEGT